MTISANDSASVADLQFDSAEPAGDAAKGACTGCAAPISSVYHVLNDEVICSACRQRAEKASAVGASRLPLAFVFGGAAAVLGAVLYVGVAAVTGYEIGLIAIAVGWLVGKAVSKASGGAGGPAYQWTAVGLTYLSILPIYILPALVEGRVRGIVSILLLPFTQGLGNVLGILIMAFGLFQAWSLNQRREMALAGPYQVKPAAAGAEGAVAGV